MRRLSHEEINRIKNSVNIVDVVSTYVSLRPEGKNFFGVCPFHDDTNPSMSVSPEKQIYRCFSCGASGSVINFVMDYEKISFIEAVKKIADLGGERLDVGYVPRKKDTGDLYKIYELSLKYYMNNINTPSGKEAREYLANRKLGEDIIKEFQIGLSLNTRNTLANILIKKFNNNDVEKSGLIGKGDYGYYDLFSDRIMFPLYNLNGQVIAYSGRIYNKKDNAKYFNTRETEIFKKGELLYNYHRARNVSRMKNKVIIMEGFMDVIRSYSVGIKNTVAAMGTAFTKEQTSLIKRMAKDIILCFDGDEAGEKATESCIKELSKAGVVPKIVRLPEGLDPDEYILKYGAESFQRMVDNPISVIDFELNYLKKGKDLSTPEDQAKYVSQVIDVLNTISDDILKDITIKKVVDDTGIDEALIRRHLGVNNDKKTIKKVVNKTSNLSKYEKAEKNLIYFMLKSDDVIKMYDKRVTFMPDKDYRLLAREISAYYHEYGEIDESDFMNHIEGDSEFKETLKKVNKNMLSDDFSVEEIDDYINVIKEYNVNNAIKRMQDKMKSISDPLKKVELAKKIIDLKKGV